MLYQLSYASPFHPENRPETATTAPKNGMGTLPLHAPHGTEIKVSTAARREQTRLNLRRSGRDALVRWTRRRTPQIVLVLKVQPELRRQAEVNAQPQRRVGRDGRLAAHNAARPQRGHANIHAESTARQPQRLHELGQQNLSGMNQCGIHRHVNGLLCSLLCDRPYRTGTGSE